ncbi:MAG: Mg-dependent DNase [uncultured bacterium (gcode 4)]|uniref:Mg-dependent DNase n=1 Tax=uncultured bacterium (gcode 4) TaxID=1234023 RepID=K2H2C0_9BACT|nr:MAG: Mg-dependent DNase [uncultured bacterium (gcode 4)]
MIFDTHCHMQFDDYTNIDEELQKMKELWVKYATLIWSDFESTGKALELAKKYDNLFVVAWIMHPIEAPLVEDLQEEMSKVEKQIEENRSYIVWIWEVWLDYFHLDPYKAEMDKMTQKRVFKANIELAKKFSLPLIIHIRDAWEDAYEILKNSDFNRNMVIHCYTSDAATAEKFLSLSDKVYIWFSWIVTFKNWISVQEAVKIVPLERILVETDAPYLAPTPYRWQQNTPAYTKYVLDMVKELRNEDPDELEKAIFENSLRFYGIED